MCCVNDSQGHIVVINDTYTWLYAHKDAIRWILILQLIKYNFRLWILISFRDHSMSKCNILAISWSFYKMGYSLYANFVKKNTCILPKHVFFLSNDNIYIVYAYSLLSYSQVLYARGLKVKLKLLREWYSKKACLHAQKIVNKSTLWSME